MADGSDNAPTQTQSGQRYNLADLLYLMQRLRDPDGGCPWDRAQDFASIVPHTLEECYELADAIESGDSDDLRSELGDVLFQVVFYAQLGAEQGRFTFDDVVQGLVEKLLRRHPHVFPEGTLASRVSEQTTASAQVKQSWEAIKAEERQDRQRAGVLDDIPLALPAISRAAKLQKRASRVGFDWAQAADVMAHLASELDELEQARRSGCDDHIEEEFGDLLFCMVNLARHWKIDPERSLRGANRKFERRFRYIEAALASEGDTPAGASLARMDALWEESKTRGL